MKVIERATTPNGIEIQIEDWSGDYDFMAYAGTIAAYPIAQESSVNTFEPKIGQKFRLSFDFTSTKEAATCFEQLKTGKKRLTDFASDKDKKYLREVSNG